jgi:hypothetical protein
LFVCAVGLAQKIAIDFLVSMGRTIWFGRLIFGYGRRLALFVERGVVKQIFFYYFLFPVPPL